MIARSITLDTSRAGSQLSMTVRKGETSIYSLAVSFCEKGTPIYVPDTYTAILRGYKADGTAVSRNATITGGRVTTGFPEQSFTAVGVAQFEIDCYGPGGEVLFSPEFDVLVEDTVSEGAVQSSNDFTALQQALMQANRGFVIQGVPYASIGALKAAITEPNMGDLYEVEDGFAYDIYRWTGDTSVGDEGWLNHGHISGKSAYEVAVDGGYAGTQAEWLASLKGTDGKSAYEVAVAGGYSGTQAQWLASLVGADGQGVPTGGAIGQALVKSGATDYATGWATMPRQYTAMPTITAGLLGSVAQYIGVTGTYTFGHFYAAVSDGESTPTYSWEEIVYGDPNSVSYSEQSGKTEAEKAQARSNIGAQAEGALLWTNAAPASAFAAQTLSLALATYNHVLIVYMAYANAQWGYDSKILPKGLGALYHVRNVYGDNQAYQVYRPCTVSDTSIIFDNGRNSFNYSTSIAQDNNMCIPYKIYGLKI